MIYPFQTSLADEIAIIVVFTKDEYWLHTREISNANCKRRMLRNNSDFYRKIKNQNCVLFIQISVRGIFNARDFRFVSYAIQVIRWTIYMSLSNHSNPAKRQHHTDTNVRKRNNMSEHWTENRPFNHIHNPISVNSIGTGQHHQAPTGKVEKEKKQKYNHFIQFRKHKSNLSFFYAKSNVWVSLRPCHSIA